MDERQQQRKIRHRLAVVRLVNANHALVAVDATIMNGRNRPEIASFTLTTATGG